MNRKAFQNGIIAAVFSLVISALVLFNIFNSDISKRKTETEILLQNQSSVIERNFITAIERLYALQAFIVGSGGSYEHIDVVCDYILEAPDIRNVSIAPNSIVEKVLPLDGNEAVLGMNLTSKSNKSYLDAIATIEFRVAVFSGPYELAQGGQAISVRLPVYLKDSSGKEKYWGLTSISINYPDIITRAANYLVESGYDYVLLKIDPSTGDYKGILEHRETARDDFVTHDFSVQNMDFRFCAIPRIGFLDIEKACLLVFVAIFISIIAGVVVTSLSLLTRNLVEKAGKDALTGLLNREGGSRLIDSRINEWPFKKGAFVLMDIDYFKSVNDTMGHPKGDEVLIETASLLKDICRSMDIVCRLGGDEFVIYFSYDCDSDFVLKKADNIRELMQRTVSSGASSVNITASLGISFVSAGEKSFERLYKESDLALYNSKRSGRNAVTFYDDISPDKS